MGVKYTTMLTSLLEMTVKHGKKKRTTLFAASLEGNLMSNQVTDLFDEGKQAATKARVEAHLARAPYEEQAEKFLRNYGIKFHTDQNVYECPLFCETQMNDLDRCTSHGLGYTIRFVRKTGCKSQSLSLRFWASRNDYIKGREPDAYDVLSCIQKQDPGTFSNFCGDCGYSEDSRKAEAIYKAVVKDFKKVKKFFTDPELADLAEIN